jgi:membrane associated rhomboid family serine protease
MATATQHKSSELTSQEFCADFQQNWRGPDADTPFPTADCEKTVLSRLQELRGEISGVEQPLGLPPSVWFGLVFAIILASSGYYCIRGQSHQRLQHFLQDPRNRTWSLNACGLKLDLEMNAPAVLVVSFISLLVHIVGRFAPSYTLAVFAAWPMAHFDRTKVVSYLRLFCHVFGHVSWEHLGNNLSLLLLVGPTCEDRYGSLRLVQMLLFTALITSAIHMAGGDQSLLMGISGIIFMCILLNSFSAVGSGTVPATFVITAAVWGGKEFYLMCFRHDSSTSHLAHLLGAACGAAFGYLIASERHAKGVSAMAQIAPRPFHTPQEIQPPFEAGDKAQ